MNHKGGQIYGTTILSVRKDNKVTIAGDCQVSFGNTVLKSSAKKILSLCLRFFGQSNFGTSFISKYVTR